MSDLLSIDPKTSALLLMDLQGFVLDNFLKPNAASEVVSNASKLLDASRSAGVFIAHVKVSFRPGYPEISPRNKLFSMLKESGLVDPDGEGTKIHRDLTPQSAEPVVLKHRIGAFSGTDLELMLRARGIETIILAGVTTSGVVLSTVRQAFDLDCQLVVANDACADGDEEAHTFLIEKVLPQQAAVMPTADIASALRCRLE